MAVADREGNPVDGVADRDLAPSVGAGRGRRKRRGRAAGAARPGGLQECHRCWSFTGSGRTAGCRCGPRIPPGQASRRRRARRGGRPSAPRPHPFAVAPGELADAPLAGAGAGDLAAKAVDDELTLRLPSVTDGPGPLASPELVRPRRKPEAAAETPAAAKRVALAAWRVPVLVFEPAAATALLPALAGLAASGPAPGELVSDQSASGAVDAPAVGAPASGAPASTDPPSAAPPSGAPASSGLTSASC